MEGLFQQRLMPVMKYYVFRILTRTPITHSEVLLSPVDVEVTKFQNFLLIFKDLKCVPSSCFFFFLVSWF